jgi:hypothetical protein
MLLGDELFSDGGIELLGEESLHERLVVLVHGGEVGAQAPPARFVEEERVLDRLIEEKSTAALLRGARPHLNGAFDEAVAEVERGQRDTIDEGHDTWRRPIGLWSRTAAQEKTEGEECGMNGEETMSYECSS